METLWTRNRSLEAASRWWQGGNQTPAGRTLTTEAAILIVLGILAAAATSLGNFGVSLPGHAILRGTLPLVLGISLVPRRGAGTVMSVAAGLTFAVAHLASLGTANAAAAVGVLALGPALDAALAGARPGWQLYTRAALAGLVANLLAFGVRLGVASFAAEAAGGKNFLSFWPAALLSFAVFGAVAGLISGMAWFRAQPRSEDIR